MEYVYFSYVFGSHGRYFRLDPRRLSTSADFPVVPSCHFTRNLGGFGTVQLAAAQERWAILGTRHARF